jgi:threonine dehydratase
MSDGLVTRAEIERAAAEIGGSIIRTPTVRSVLLSERLGLELYLKLELQQHTGSFKARGALNRIRQLSAAERASGVITVSAGNHAQAVAWAARGAGVSATVVMPEGAVQMKIDATRAQGAEVILAPGAELLATMQRIQRERGLVFIPPFDDRAVIAGAATCGMELLEDVPAPDAILVGVGGGGIVSGLIAAVHAHAANTTVHGVEPEGAPGMTRSIAQGTPVRLDRVDTIADGLAAPWAGTLNVEHVQRGGGLMVTVPDSAILEALWVLRNECELPAEPAAAAGLAALLSGAVRPARGSRIVCVITGRNVDAARLQALGARG